MLTSANILEFADGLIRQAVDLADVVLCPSQWVAQGVAALSPADAPKVRICPYGSSIAYSGRVHDPAPGRVFYAGGCPVRKGLPDLARAADILKPKYPHMDFRVAGITDRVICRRPECRNLTFLGNLSGAAMQEEFLSADMFVLPTHAEGLASAVVEAIAAGCPVITTRRAGVSIHDGVDGVLLAPGDADSLVAAVERIYCDRGLRAMLSANTKRLAGEYTMEAWKGRLVNVLREV